jgi:hypothetical protein
MCFENTVLSSQNLILSTNNDQNTYEQLWARRYVAPRPRKKTFITKEKDEKMA